MMECLKTSTVKSIALKHKRDETAWLRTISTSPPNVGDAFKDIIEQTTRHGGWDLVGQGIVSLRRQRFLQFVCAKKQSIFCVLDYLRISNKITIKSKKISIQCSLVMRSLFTGQLENVTFAN
jgi:hypothetical protein